MTTDSKYLSAMSFRTKILERYNDCLASINPSATKDVRDSVPPGLYEHFKSKPDDCKFYIVYGAGFQQTTLQPSVYYTSVYGANAGYPTDRRLLHEEDGFLTPINREAYVGPRFTLIMKLNALEIGILIQNTDTLSHIKGAEEFKLYVREILMK